MAPSDVRIHAVDKGRNNNAHEAKILEIQGDRNARLSLVMGVLSGFAVNYSRE